MRRHSIFADREAVFVTGRISSAVVIAAIVAALGAGAVLRNPAAAQQTEIPADVWSGDRAMDDIAALLKFTPRSIGAPGHQQTIDYIESQLAKTPFSAVARQRWTFRGDDGAGHAMTNLVARLNPSNPRRVIVATHYDSIVRAYADSKDPDGPMPGANNSASGVAMLLETARALGRLPSPAVGIDMIFFDGEEGPKSLGAGDPRWFAIGSPYFTAHLSDFYPDRKPESGVDFDMVCYRALQLKPELSSVLYAGTQTVKFWSIGATNAPDVFLRTPTPYPISDDHTALTAAGIPSLLVIDFEYDPWFNTTQDTIDKCSAASLGAVGRTLLHYLYQQ
jgi:glutaminyl-peptide cyclotransferase